ncbi:MAG: outer membrane lipoprotein-sorting protein [Gammaproteobacteria bacterium]|nr:outer membrane lipoprotein-sorting protein [Gammaproteobacteria bacterium]
MLSLSASAVASAETDADAIMRAVRDRDDGRSFLSQVSLILHDKNGNARTREFLYLQKDYPEGDKFTMFFSAPADVRDVAFHIENPKEAQGREDSQWMYLPVSRQTRRISTSDKRGAFMGSEYSYADLDKVRVGDYRQKLVGDEVLLERPCHVIEREPASPETLTKTGYNKLKVWVDKENHLVMRQDFFDVKGVLVKQMRTLSVATIDGIDSIMLSETEHFIDGTRSEMRFNQLKYNIELDDKLFTQAAIRRGLKAGDLPENALSSL